MPTVEIYCLVNGLIEFGPKCPENCFSLAKAEKEDAEVVLDAILASYGQRFVPVSQEVRDALRNGDTDVSAAASYDSMMTFRARLIRALEKDGKNYGEE